MYVPDGLDGGVGVALYPLLVVKPGFEARVGEEPTQGKGIYMANNTTNLITCIQ